MTPSTPVQDLAAQWKRACRLYPTYFELAREFAIDVKSFPQLEAGVDNPGKEIVEQANQWLEKLDDVIQVHQLRQFLQTSSLVNQEGLLLFVQHFLSKKTKSDILRDKIDFVLVQYFSQKAPAGLSDDQVDLAYVAQSLQPLLGEVELKPPVWLNAMDRVLESARRCQTLDELLHGGILEQGRKAKGLAGDLFYLPVALVAFTRFGYLMRKTFFRLMLGELNTIMDGLTTLEEKGITAVDCRRAQFSSQEPIIRLRMICQSWKVMFQAEYSSGQPLRMLVDLRASVDQALGRGKAAEPAGSAAKAKIPVASKAGARPAGASAAPAKASAAAAGAGVSGKNVSVTANPKPGAKLSPSGTPEFKISGASGGNPDSKSGKKK